jgi:hypothetical protein
MITARQLTVFAAVAVLSVGIREISAMAAAGHIGMLAHIAALPAGLFVMFMMGILYKKYPGAGLDEIFTRSLGKFFGSIMLLLAGAAVPLTVAALTARTHSELFTSTIFSGAQPYYFLIPAIAVTFFITRRRVEDAARLGTALALVLFIALATVFFVSIGNISIKNLLPIYTDDLLPFARISLYGLTVPAFIVMGNLLSRDVSNRGCLRREGVWASVTMCVGLTLINIICVGVLGAGLTARSMSPIFTAVKSLSIPGVFERVDALTVMVWIASDIMLLALSGFVFIRSVMAVFNVKNRTVLAAVFALLVLTAAPLLGRSEFAVLKIETPLLAACSAVVLGVFALVFAVGAARR